MQPKRHLLSSLVLCTLPVLPCAAATVFINELHYDNAGTDDGEGVEIAGAAGVDLGGWQLVLYNGSNGQTYATTALDGVLSDESDGFGAAFFALAGMQNGPDGIALVDGGGGIVQFLSYEGEFAAADGPAAGLVSTAIGVAEATDTPLGLSLQLTGVGRDSADFTWAGPAPSSYGGLNAGQSFAAVPLPGALPLLAAALSALGFARRSAKRLSHRARA